MISKYSDFERFLEANYPSAYLKISSEDVKEDVYFSIFSRYEARFRKWQKIPGWIKDFYRDAIPVDILNGNITVDDFVENLEYIFFRSPDRDVSKIRLNNYRNVVYVEEKIIERYKDKIALGYCPAHARKLAENSYIRHCMCALCRPLTDDERKIWRKTRKSDIHIVKEHFKKNEPEKMVFHSIKKYDIYMRKMLEERNTKKKLEYLLEAAKYKYEIFKYLPRVNNVKVKKGLLRMYVVAKKQLGHKRMAEARKRIAEYVTIRRPVKKINEKVWADAMTQMNKAS